MRAAAGSAAPSLGTADERRPCSTRSHNTHADRIRSGALNLNAAHTCSPALRATSWLIAHAVMQWVVAWCAASAAGRGAGGEVVSLRAPAPPAARRHGRGRVRMRGQRPAGLLHSTTLLLLPGLLRTRTRGGPAGGVGMGPPAAPVIPTVRTTHWIHRTAPAGGAGPLSHPRRW